MDQREQERLTILSILRGGRMRYAEVLAEYGRRFELGAVQAGEPFAALVHDLIVEKLVGYAVDQNAGGQEPPTTTLWLRPQGQARLDESGPMP
jgi:hypothetical protein